MFDQSARGRERVRTTGTDRQHAIVRSDHIAVAGKQKRTLIVGDDEQSLQMSKYFVGPPLFAKFNRGSLQIAVVLFKFGFEASQERQGITRGAGKTSQHFVVIQTANFLRPS